MSNLQCPVDADLLEAVGRGDLTADEAATYTACRQVVALRGEVADLKKKVEAVGSRESPVTLVPIDGP